MSTGSFQVVKTQHNISSHYHALAPYQRLPFELLVEIFVQCISASGFEELTRHYLTNPFLCVHWMYPHHIRARLALVCRAWCIVIYNDPRVWTTMVLLDTLTHPEMISLWLKKSKSMPLVVFIHCRIGWGLDSVFSMLHKEMWRIRCLFLDISIKTDLSALFPLDISTNAPMLQSLALFRPFTVLYRHAVRLGDIHCPELRTLFLNDEIKSMTVRPFKNVHHLSVNQIHDIYVDNGSLAYLKLLEALPNLVSLKWSSRSSNHCTLVSVEVPSIVLQSLESLTLHLCCKGMMTSILKGLHVPSLERLVLLVEECYDLTESTDAICDTLDRLRHLTLLNISLGSGVHALLNHLKHLETITIEKLHGANLDELFIALSSHNRDSSIPYPSLKTVDISYSVEGCMDPDVLVHFVQQRVKSDLDDPAPGLVTCLKLSFRRCYDKELCAQLVKTHSSSISFLD